jgi:predicted amino acid racemase/arginase family enzyme
MRHPFLDIDLDKIEHNCRVVTGLCRERGVEVAGVTKVVRGMPKVARALLRGGVAHVADSRLENIARIRDDGIRAEVMMLRIPRLSDAQLVVELADLSLNSEPAVVRALSAAAERAGRVHRVVLMIDTGDLREGVLPRDALEVAEAVAGLGGVELHGVGTNLACLSGIRPTKANMELLVGIAEDLRARLGIPLPMVSGGNSFNLPLLESGEMPAGVNHLRLGSSMLMGLLLSEETRARVRGDAFLLHAEILELKDKPSLPHGEVGEDAFGRRPDFEDRGTMRRAILDIGREDIVPEYLVPVDAGAKVLGASSDHLVVDVTGVGRELAVGGEMVFDLDYGAVLAAMTSDYVHKNLIYSRPREPGAGKVRILGVPREGPAGGEGGATAPRLVREQGLGEQLLEMGLDVVDDGDLEIAAGGVGEKAPDAPIAEAVFAALRAGETPLLLGGPHSLLHGELAGLTRFTPEFGLICFDAHGDLINTIAAGWEGAPLSLSLENFALVGVRDLSADERRLLEGSPITVFTMEEIDRRGMVEVMERSLEVALNAVDGLHVSLDIDFVDARDAPAAVEPEPGGINYREAHLAMEMIAESRSLLSADVTEIDPAHPAGPQTARLAVGLLASLLGRKLLRASSG